MVVNCFLTRWAKESPRFADEKIFILENITQMYPRGQSHLERAPAHLLTYWFMPTASSSVRKTKPWENGVGSVGWSLLVFVSCRSWGSDSPVCRFWRKTPNNQTKCVQEQISSCERHYITQQDVLLGSSQLLEGLSFTYFWGLDLIFR